MSNRDHIDSDSETDEDYVPPADEESGSTGEEDTTNPATEVSEAVKPCKEEEEAKKAAKDAIWASFQASVATTSVQPVKSEEKARKVVKIEKRYKFAGEDTIEVEEVEEDSEDARKWPLWHPPTSEEGLSQLSTSNPDPPNAAVPSLSKPTSKRPGPRKSKVLLSGGPPKAKKLSTLEKSAMDWRAHVASESSSGLQDELEANRRGGGYLEKVDFLKRVEERKEDVLETSRSTKRRKT